MVVSKLPKSQRQIKNAFLEVLKTKSFHHVTVRDIVEQAELGRSTFYLYYDDKYELLEEIETELINGFIQLMLILRDSGREDFVTGIMNGHYAVYVEYFKYIKKNGRAFEILLNYKSETNFTFKLSKAIASTRNETERLWNTKTINPEIETQYQYWDTIISSIYVSIINTWLQRGMDLSEQKMGQMLTNIWKSLLTNMYPQIYIE